MISAYVGLFISAFLLGLIIGIIGAFIFYKFNARQKVNGKSFGILNEPKVEIDKNILSNTGQKDYSVDDFK